MNFVCLLMSDSELLRIKNKQKASYKSRKAARSNQKKLIRPNDRFGFNQLCFFLIWDYISERAKLWGLALFGVP